MWLPDAGLYHYRARAYDPNLGRFLQTDPIGYAAGANLYVYVGGDPVNRADPLGLCPDTTNYFCFDEGTEVDDVIVTGHRCPPNSICDPNEIRRLADELDPAGSHLYNFEAIICFRSFRNCTPSIVYQCLLRNPAPGAANLSQPVRDGGVSNVRVVVPLLGVVLVEGRVRHDVIPESWTLINRTLPGHTLHPGDVYRNVRTSRVVGIPAINLSTTGIGEGALPTMNEFSASIVWGSNAADISTCVDRWEG